MCYLIEEDELLQEFQEVEEYQLWIDEGVDECAGREFAKD